MILIYQMQATKILDASCFIDNFYNMKIKNINEKITDITKNVDGTKTKDITMISTGGSIMEYTNDDVSIKSNNINGKHNITMSSSNGSNKIMKNVHAGGDLLMETRNITMTGNSSIMKVNNVRTSGDVVMMASDSQSNIDDKLNSYKKEIVNSCSGKIKHVSRQSIECSNDTIELQCEKISNGGILKFLGKAREKIVCSITHEDTNKKIIKEVSFY